MDPIRQLLFVVNASKAGAIELAADLMEIAKTHGVEARALHTFPVPTEALVGCDACCVIGGDGTLLGVARAAAEAGVPIIGVNRGSLGFLTTFSAEQARHSFARILAGEFNLATRSLLDCSTEPGQHDLALNDVLIKDEQHSRLVELAVYANDDFVTTYTCDGLIFSSPTGSTAYNLSAGGPLIHPAAQVIVLTPICPHTLSNRSIIFRDDVRLRIEHRNRDGCVLIAIDGQRNLRTCEGAAVEITVSSRQLQLVQRHDYDHFGVIRTKLKWSGGVTNGD